MNNSGNYKAIINDEIKYVNKLIANKEYNKLLLLDQNYELNNKSVSIISSFLENYKKKNLLQKEKLIIISNFSFQVFSRELINQSIINGIKLEIDFLTISEMMDEAVIKKYKNKSYSIFLYIDHRDFDSISSFDNNLIFKSKHLKEIRFFYNMLIENIKKIKPKSVFLSTAPDVRASEFLNYAENISFSKENLIKKFNKHILKIVSENNFNLIDIYKLASKYGLNNFYDDQKYLLAKLPFKKEFCIFFNKLFINLISTKNGKLKKVLVLDLDNTIWGGVIGDDGFENLKLGPDSAEGMAFQNFQRVIKNLKDRGIILAISSKNNHDTAMQAFKKNKNMILREKDFSCIKINWDDKAKNIKNISNELNLSLDSFVFIDDNPVERDLVRTFLPEVTVPEIPNDPSLYSVLILDSYIFDIINLSKEDKKRAASYISNLKREKFKKKFNSTKDYLFSLDMKSIVSEFKINDINRVQQLFQRSNQFNMNTIRYDITEIKNFIKDKNVKTFQFSLKDKFTNYGIISLMVCKKKVNTIYIDNWVMSCRVLGRQMEQFVFSELLLYCKQNNIKKIIGSYTKSAKNQIVSDLYLQLGFIESTSKKDKKEFYYDKVNVIKEKLPIRSE